MAAKRKSSSNPPPARDLKAFAQELADKATVDANRKVAEANAKLRVAEHANAQLVKDRDEALDQYRDLQTLTYPKPVKFRPRARAGRRDKVRVIIPDIHGAEMDRPAVEACLSDIRILDPDEVVIMGDLVECGGFLAAHHTLGYVSQTAYSYQADIAAANWFLDALAKAAPRAQIHYLEGNHEDRVERWVIDQTMRHQRDAEYLRTLIAPQSLLQLETRGIAYYRRGERYMGLQEPGWIKLGKVYFVHELSNSRHAAASSVAETAGNINYAHTHREDSSSLVLPGVGLVKAWCAGCLCERQPLWRHSKPTQWSHGYGIEFIAASGSFLHVNVPIWKGKSLLGGLADKLKG